MVSKKDAICNNTGTMTNENALAVYKTRPVIVKEINNDKVTILTLNKEKIAVREKDLAIIHPGPVEKGFGDCCPANSGTIRETWELLLAEGGTVSLRELAELAFGEYTPSAAWGAYSLVADGLYFAGTISAIKARQKDQVEADEQKRLEKQRAGEERGLFLERLRNRSPHLAEDRRFIQDIEALACGKSEKSRTMKSIGLGETPEEAHALLLSCGFWTKENNPHPERFGISLNQARHIPDPIPEEGRADLTGLAAFAIDSPWSHDPDDAVSLEIENGKQALYVHVADPSASIGSSSLPEREARDRGATLYIPEGSFRMLAEEALPAFALGLEETSAAMTFKMMLGADGEIEKSEIFLSKIKVKRLTYQEADTIAGEKTLSALFAVADRNLCRRERAGAITIDLPETHIGLCNGEVIIEPVTRYRSADMVRECMLLAGEAAGNWAIQRNLPIPFIEQELAEIPAEVSPGIAGSYQLRRCMKGRNLSVKPGLHHGLGLDVYTQVTSPLRRYTDLLSHMQIRSHLRMASGTGAPLSADEVTARMIAGEAAAIAVTQAERASRSHWTMVYLSGKKDSVWEAIALEKKGNRWAVIIPALGFETQVPLRKEVAPNDRLSLVLKSADIPRLEAVFIPEE